MAHGLLSTDYKPQFVGHETFPLRYGWLKKAYDRVAETENQKENREDCWGDDAVMRFGVGKNMVAAMRHWAKATGVTREPAANKVETTELGKMLFGNNGRDPYMEHPATLWLIHWQLAGRVESKKTTWFWAFSHYTDTNFERDNFETNLLRFAGKRGWKSVALQTIKNDVACFIRTYVARQPSGKTGHDDALESPLTELGLIKAIGKKDGFRFVRGPKITLSNGVFAYALLDFWSQYSPNTRTLSFEAISHASGGPGRVFLLDENDVVDRLSVLDKVTNGALEWSETAGLKQVVRNTDINKEAALHNWVSRDYNPTPNKEAA
ncbi:MAG: DUF4007 family protein [Candidatus Dadabacteria bacterium]|nr:DUF4007 family protein [Candidatus Dadabacteria bacterium]